MKYFTFDFTLCMFQIQPTLYQAYRTKIKKAHFTCENGFSCKRKLGEVPAFFSVIHFWILPSLTTSLRKTLDNIN